MVAAATPVVAANPWALVPMIASMGLSAIGQYQGMKGAVKGAESSAAIEKMSREYQTKVFLKGIERQKPFYEAGRAAIPLYDKALGGEDVPDSGLAKWERGMVDKDISSMSDHVKNLAHKRTEAVAGEKMKGRLMDIMQIGLGQSGSAGQSAVNLGTRMAGSIQRGGGALANAQLTKDVGMQNIYSSAMDSLSGLPAYMASQPDRKRVSAPNPPMSSDYIGDFPQYGGGSYA